MSIGKYTMISWKNFLRLFVSNIYVIVEQSLIVTESSQKNVFCNAEPHINLLISPYTLF